MVDAVEEAVGQAAGKALLQIEAALARQGEGSGIEGGGKGGAIGLGGVGDVMGTLEPALDLEASDTELHEVVDQIVGGEVLGAEQVSAVAEVAGLAIDDHLVG